MTNVAALWILLGSWLGPGNGGAPLNRCLEVDRAVDTPDVAPIPLPTNPMPRYPPFLLDAGIGDTIVVQFVVRTDGSVDQSSYCVERSSGYSVLTAGAAEVREWRFSPALYDGSVVPAKYRLIVVFAPRDTVRGPISGARVIGETHQPMLQGDQPVLMIGPMRLTFNVPRIAAVGEVRRGVRDSLVSAVLDLANLKDSSPVCVGVAPGKYLEWDDATRTTKGEPMRRCGGGRRSEPYTEIWLARDDSRAGRHEGSLIRIPVSLRTNDYSHCDPNAFLCGGGLAIVFDCEVQVSGDGETVQCAIVERRRWVS